MWQFFKKAYSICLSKTSNAQVPLPGLITEWEMKERGGSRILTKYEVIGIAAMCWKLLSHYKEIEATAFKSLTSFCSTLQINSHLTRVSFPALRFFVILNFALTAHAVAEAALGATSTSLCLYHTKFYSISVDTFFTHGQSKERKF